MEGAGLVKRWHAALPFESTPSVVRNITSGDAIDSSIYSEATIYTVSKDRRE